MTPNLPLPLTQKRIQLTLFLHPDISTTIEQVRERFNPAQFELIAAHVTLCREDELEPLDRVLRNLEQLEIESVCIDFGPPVRFSEGKGVFIPALGDQTSFQDLRKAILQGVVENPRVQEPHITLLHPRNSECTDSIFAEIEKLELPRTIEFGKICLIEQAAGGKWKVLKAFDLPTRTV